MKMLRTLFAVISLTFALAAQAVPVTVTINVPQYTWVDPGGTTVAPYVGVGVYVDGSGYLWNFTPAASAPTATGYAGAPAAALMFESTNCTGTARFNLNPNSGYFSGVALLTTTGGFYAVGNTLSVTLRSAWYSGACYAYSNAAAPYEVYAATSVTQPTLPAGPYHLEFR